MIWSAMISYVATMDMVSGVAKDRAIKQSVTETYILTDHFTNDFP